LLLAQEPPVLGLIDVVTPIQIAFGPVMVTVGFP
jgi:hypothetical protein